jgi:hypothetical protein
MQGEWRHQIEIYRAASDQFIPQPSYAANRAPDQEIFQPPFTGRLRLTATAMRPLIEIRWAPFDRASRMTALRRKAPRVHMQSPFG